MGHQQGPREQHLDGVQQDYARESNRLKCLDILKGLVFTRKLPFQGRHTVSIHSDARCKGGDNTYISSRPNQVNGGRVALTPPGRCANGLCHRVCRNTHDVWSTLHKAG